jgi:hypothetical protein
MSFIEISAMSTPSVALNMGDSHRIATFKLFYFLGQIHGTLAYQKRGFKSAYVISPTRY